MKDESLLMGVSALCALTLLAFAVYTFTQLPSMKARLKHLAKTIGLGLALYIGTAVCLLGTFILGMTMNEHHLIGDWFALPLEGCFFGPLPLQDMAAGWISSVVWQLLAVSTAAFISGRVGRATRFGWKVAVPLYISLILLMGLVAALRGYAADPHYGLLHGMRF